MAPGAPMEFESYERETPTINISALIDVVFILLIFVVLAANFDRIREMNIALPSAEEVEEPTEEALVLTLPKDDVPKLDGEPVERANLEAELARYTDDYDILVLAGDGSVELEQAVEVFDRAAAVGFESVSIATEQEMQ